jgi:hypothetical protein
MSDLIVINDPSNSINTIEMSGNTLVNKGITYNDIYRNIISTGDNMYSYIESKTKYDINTSTNVSDGEELHIGMNRNVKFDKITLNGTDFSQDKSVATVKYVNDNLNKLDAKDSVLVATTENLSLSGLLTTIDDVDLVANNRVLVKDQADKKQNGIYIAAAGDWTRSADFVNASKQQGSYVYVEAGTAHKNKGFMLTGPEKTVGTSELEFAQFNGAPAFEAGDGLTSIGNTLKLDESLNNVTTMSGLTAVGSADVNTIFSGPVVANEGLEGDLSGNAATATNLQTARLIGGVSFDGTADISLPGVNQPGNQDTTGNAATASAAAVDSALASKISKLSDNGDTYTGNVTGNADSATALQTAITIGGVSFDGTADISLPGVNTAGTQNTSGNAATASAAAVDSVLANKISKLSDNGETYSGNVTGDLSGNAATATKLETSRAIGGVPFNGTADINLSGVNQIGNQDTTGNASTATALQTSRAIGGVSFDGTANINLPGVNSEGSQDTTGNAATASAAKQDSALANKISKLTDDGNVLGNVTGDVIGNVTGYIILPIENPDVSGALWNNNGTLAVSQG